MGEVEITQDEINMLTSLYESSTGHKKYVWEDGDLLPSEDGYLVYEFTVPPGNVMTYKVQDGA